MSNMSTLKFKEEWLDRSESSRTSKRITRHRTMKIQAVKVNEDEQ